MLWHKIIGFAILAVALTQLDLVHSDVASNGCKNNYSLIAGKCLLASNSWYTWFEADRHCRSQGAGLLSLQNQTQLQQIEKWLNTSAPWVMELWTSGNTLGQKGIYYWQDTGEQARYLPWSTGEPKPSVGDCLALYGNKYNTWGYSDYRLSIRNCTGWSGFICEQQPQNVTSRICLKPGTYETAQVVV